RASRRRSWSAAPDPPSPAEGAAAGAAVTGWRSSFRARIGPREPSKAGWAGHLEGGYGQARRGSPKGRIAPSPLGRTAVEDLHAPPRVEARALPPDHGEAFRRGHRTRTPGDVARCAQHEERPQGIVGEARIDPRQAQAGHRIDGRAQED